MSAIALHLSPGPDHGPMERMLEAMRRPGPRRFDVTRSGDATLGVTRQEWETDRSIGGPAIVASDGEVAVAADAALFYRDDLRAALAAAGAESVADAPAELILAAYRAWDVDCARYLEGDFAFVLYDSRRRRVLAARDFAGRRPLHFARVGGGLVVASTIGGLLAHPACDAGLNLAAIAEDAAGLTGSPTETCYRAVTRLPAAHTLVWEGSGSPKLIRHWDPVATQCGEGATFAESAQQLLGLLRGAVRERLPLSGAAAITLSGGWDSPAVFAAARTVHGDQRPGAHLRPVSISYPVGDPGREDEVIEAILARWDSSTRWIRSDQIAFWPDAARRAASRDEPFAHAFEDWNRALFEAARAEGTTVVLDGYGGDQLFQVSTVFFADLVRRGAVRELAREWRARGLSVRDGGAMWQWMLLPLLPDGLRHRARRLGLDGRLRTHLERPIPGWLAADFVQRHALLEREITHNPVRWHGDRSVAEMKWYLRSPVFPRVMACLGRLAEEVGVEARSPLFDRRVVEFALSRPRWERASGHETKRLLRAAVGGLLPEWTLAPRKWRTGTTDGYLGHSLRESFAPALEQVLSRPLLAEVGIADPVELRRLLDRFVRDGEVDLGLQLFHAAQAETWLRARVVGAQGVHEEVAIAAV